MEPQNGALKAHFPSENVNFEVSNLVFVGSNSLTSRSLGYTFKTAAISQHGVSEPSKHKNSMTRPIPNFSWNPGDSWQTIGKKWFWVVVSARVSIHPKYSIKSVKITAAPFSQEDDWYVYNICINYNYILYIYEYMIKHNNILPSQK